MGEGEPRARKPRQLPWLLGFFFCMFESWVSPWTSGSVNAEKRLRVCQRQLLADLGPEPQCLKVWSSPSEQPPGWLDQNNRLVCHVPNQLLQSLQLNLVFVSTAFHF